MTSLITKSDLEMLIGHFHDGVAYYNYQNPLVFRFLMLICAVVI